MLCCSMATADQVMALLTYLIQAPGPDATEMRRLKYPFMACEILSCDIVAITDLLATDEALAHLLSFLDSSERLDSRLAGYFEK